METEEVFYKIRDKKTGLFALGGSRYWTKKGKVWTNLKNLKLHLNYVLEHSYYDDRLNKYMSGDVEIVEIKTVYSEHPFMNIKDYINDLKIKKEEEEKRREKRWKEYEEKKKRKKYEELKKEFEGDK